MRFALALATMLISGCFAWHPFSLEPNRKTETTIATVITLTQVAGDNPDGTIASALLVQGSHLDTVSDVKMLRSDNSLSHPDFNVTSATGLTIDASSLAPGDYTLQVSSAAASAEVPLTLQIGDPGDAGDATSDEALWQLDQVYVQKSGDTMAGPLLYAPGLVRHYFVAPWEFVSASPWYNELVLGVSTEPTHVASHPDSGGVPAHAAISLPDGAQPLRLECGFSGDVTAGLTVSLQRLTFSNGALVGAVCGGEVKVASVGVGIPDAQSDVSACPPVDNDLTLTTGRFNAYVLVAGGTSQNTESLRGCSVEYAAVMP